MHYRQSAFAGFGISLTKGPTSNPSKISAGDACRIKELYPCGKCPKSCNPNSNNCLWPTAQNCVPFGGKATYCACAPGFKANFPNGDKDHHWRVNQPGHEHRVWVAEGVQCDVLCVNPLTCGEVSMIEDSCWK